MNDLRPYQRDGVAWMLERPACLLADQPGLGKTRQILETHRAYVERKGGAGLAIVCPKSAKAVWRAEIQKWNIPGTVHVLEGRDAWRPPEPGEIVIINYAILPWRPVEIRTAKQAGKKHGAPLGSFDWPIHLVFDEAHALRKPKSLQSARAKAMTRAVDKVTGATGTPVGGQPFDLYGMLGALRCCPWTWFEFLRKFNAFELPHGGYDFRRDASGAIVVDPSVAADLSRVMLRRLRVDVATELPPKLYRRINVDHKRATATELDRLGLALAPYFDADDLPPFTEFASVNRMIAEERIPLLADYQREREDAGQIGLIMSAHRAPVVAAGSRPGWGAIHGGVPEGERERLITDFEAGRLKGLALVLKTAATAISLPSADYVLFVDRSWDPDENEQAEDRANRMNRTKGPIEVEIWTSAHPVARHLDRILKRKSQLARDALNE